MKEEGHPSQRKDCRAGEHYEVPDLIANLVAPLRERELHLGPGKLLSLRQQSANVLPDRVCTTRLRHDYLESREVLRPSTNPMAAMATIAEPGFRRASSFTSPHMSRASLSCT